MGNKPTKSGTDNEEEFDPQLKNVFEEELQSINEIVTNIMNNKNVNTFTDEKFCDDYSIALEDELQKHLKIELLNLKQNIYLIKRQNNVQLKNGKNVRKDTLCKTIAQHYNTLLKLLQVVKLIYDLENNGDYSISGICRRNVVVVKNLMELHMCEHPHVDTSKNAKPDSNGNKDSNLIDFNKIAGMQMFTEDVLTPSEKNVFLYNLGLLLSRQESEFLADAVCKNDNLLYKKYKPSGICKEEDRQKQIQFSKDVITSLPVAGKNPVFHSDMCFKEIIYVIELNQKDEGIKLLKQLHNDMKTHYKENLAEIESILMDMVTGSKKSYQLRHLTQSDIRKVKERMGKIIATLFYTSLLDYYALIEQAKKVPHLLVDKGKIHGGGSKAGAKPRQRAPKRSSIACRKD
jgi:hypothetical protein